MVQDINSFLDRYLFLKIPECTTPSTKSSGWGQVDSLDKRTLNNLKVYGLPLDTLRLFDS